MNRQTARTRVPFLFLEGNPAWLDFVNTELVLDGKSADLLGGYGDLLDWLEARGLLSPETAALAHRKWGPGPEGTDAFRQAVAFRAALRRAASRCARGGFPASATGELNGLLARGPGTLKLVPSTSGYEIRFEPRLHEAIALLVPIARSTAEFLASEDARRVRKCRNPRCVLFYLDASKNGSRRWCSMAVCGNRIKAARFLRRHGRSP